MAKVTQGCLSDITVIQKMSLQIKASRSRLCIFDYSEYNMGCRINPIEKIMTSKRKIADFESSLKQVESLVATLDDQEATLEESLAAFEKGLKLTQTAQKILANAEQRVQVLCEKDGEPIVYEYSEDDTE